MILFILQLGRAYWGPNPGKDVASSRVWVIQGSQLGLVEVPALAFTVGDEIKIGRRCSAVPATLRLASPFDIFDDHQWALLNRLQRTLISHQSDEGIHSPCLPLLEMSARAPFLGQLCVAGRCRSQLSTDQLASRQTWCRWR